MRILLVVLPSGLCWNLWHEIGIQNTNVNKLYHSLQLLTSTNSYLDFKIILGGFSKIPPNLCGRLTALGLCERKMLTKISSKYCNYFLPHRQCELFALQSDTFLFSVSSHSEAALKINQFSNVHWYKVFFLQFIWTVTVRVLGSLISLFFATHEILLLFMSLLSLKIILNYKLAF